MVIYDFDPRNLPPELLRAVGFMTAAASQAEYIMQDLIGSLLGIDNIETMALTAHMTAPLKDQVARALIELNAANSDVVDTLDELLDHMNSAIEKRNVVVHNHFCRHPGTGEILSLRQKARGSLQVSLQPITAEQIESDALLIYEAGLKVMRFMTDCGISPKDRARPLHQTLDRRKATRKLRRSGGV